MRSEYLISFLFSFLLQLTGAQFSNEKEADVCGDLQCVSITRCPSVLKLVFQVKEGDLGAKRKLISIQCGFERSLPKVCCDLGVKEMTGRRIFPSDSSDSSKPKVKIAPAQPITTTNKTVTTTTTEKTTAFTTPFTTAALSPRTVSEEPRKSLPDLAARLNFEKCGVRTSLNLRVTFGDTAVPGQFPWLVSLMYRRRDGVSLPLCGGVLISPLHVLTAAHCDETQAGFSLHSARLGTTDLSVTPDQDDPFTGVQVEIASIKRHQQFERSPVAIFDIAIARLVRPVRFSDQIRPICLVALDEDLVRVEEPDTGLVVAGWGRTETSRSSNLLQYTFLEPVPREECRQQYGEAGLAGLLGPGLRSLDILKSQLCAQGAGVTDSCTGDSGGPLMAQVERTWYLTGIVSFGTAQCDSSLPGVYTRTSEFYSWILDMMNTL